MVKIIIALVNNSHFPVTNPLLALGKAIEGREIGTETASPSLCEDLEESLVFHFIRDNWVIQLPLCDRPGEEGCRAGEKEKGRRVKPSAAQALVQGVGGGVVEGCSVFVYGAGGQEGR